MDEALIVFLRARLADRAEAEGQARNPYEGMTADELHERRAHPAYEYRTTEGQRKAWDDVDTPPWDDELHRPGDGWELNITSRDPEAWERFDYTEERYWRRRLADPHEEWKPSAAARRALAEVDAKRRRIELHTGRAPVPGNPHRHVSGRLARRRPSRRAGSTVAAREQ